VKGGASIAEWLEAHRVDVTGVSEADVVGIGHVLTEVRSLVGRLAEPDRMAAIGASLPKGIVLHGPPGTGKTLVARLLAALVSRLARPVRFYEVSADELSPTRIRAMFRQLAMVAREGPAIVYIDEIDLIALRRGSPQLGPDERKSLTALLAGLDGLRGIGDVVVLAATNTGPDRLDGALLRPGRIDQVIRLGYPTEAELADLWSHYLAKVRVDGAPDPADLAHRTRGDTPAEVRGYVQDAAALAIAAGRDAVALTDLQSALARAGRIEPVVEPPPVSHEAALHEAGHACVAEVLRPGWVIGISASAHGGVTEAAFDGIAVTDGMLLDQAVVAFGGMAAQELLGESTSGTLSDLHDATSALLDRWRLGLDRTLPPISDAAMDHLLSQELRAEVTRTVAEAATAARARAEAIVAANGPAITRLAARLQAAGSLRDEALRDAIAEAGFRAPDDEPTETGHPAIAAGVSA
jgi:cell division protease FtsH